MEDNRMINLEAQLEYFLNEHTDTFPYYSRSWFNHAIKKYYHENNTFPDDIEIELIRLCLLNSKNKKKTEQLLDRYSFDDMWKISRYWNAEQHNLANDIFCIDTYGKIYTDSHDIALIHPEDSIEFSFVHLGPNTRLPVWQYNCVFEFNCFAKRNIIIESECFLSNVDISGSGIKRLTCKIGGTLKANSTRSLEYISPEIMFHSDVYLKKTALKRFENTVFGDFTCAYSDIEEIKTGNTFHKSCSLNSSPISKFACNVLGTLDITGTKIEHPDPRYKIGCVIKK